jgi:hypothetical protein
MQLLAGRFVKSDGLAFAHRVFSSGARRRIKPIIQRRATNNDKRMRPHHQEQPKST